VLRPSTSFEARLSGRFALGPDEPALVANVDDPATPEMDPVEVSVFSDRTVVERQVSLHASWVPLLNLSVQLFTQVLHADVDFADSLYRLEPSGDLTPVDRAMLPVDDEALHLRSLTWNTNAILRWDYLPGSTAYLVWTHTAENEDAATTATTLDDLRALGDASPVDIIFLKLTYRWGT
jgi:hypothetical protein